MCVHGVVTPHERIATPHERIAAPNGRVHPPRAMPRCTPSWHRISYLARQRRPRAPPPKQQKRTAIHIAYAYAAQGDVRSAQACEGWVAAVAREWGRLDVLVNCAAGNFLATAEELTQNGFRTGGYVGEAGGGWVGGRGEGWAGQEGAQRSLRRACRVVHLVGMRSWGGGQQGGLHGMYGCMPVAQVCAVWGLGGCEQTGG